MRGSLRAAVLLALAACGPEAQPGVPPEEAQRLAALGYVEWAAVTPDDAGRAGVIHNDAARSDPAARLLHSRAVPGAQLVSVTGELLHTWHDPVDPSRRWNHVEPTAGGGLVVATQTPSLLRLDRDSRLIWERALRVHHDLALALGGGIVALERVEVRVPGSALPLLGENLLLLDANGKPLRRVALHELLTEYLPPAGIGTASQTTPDPRSFWQRLRAGWRPLPADALHANSVELLSRDVKGLGTRGSALVSLRNLDLLAVVDLDAGALRFRFGPGVLERQHHASVTPEGRLLVFDNGRRRSHSRVVEIDPISRRVVWEFTGSPPGSLHSASQGGVERLPNGNLLVTESERGRAFEIDREGAVVWEYLHPQFDAAREARASIYRMAVWPARR